MYSNHVTSDETTFEHEPLTLIVISLLVTIPAVISPSLSVFIAHGAMETVMAKIAARDLYSLFSNSPAQTHRYVVPLRPPPLSLLTFFIASRAREKVNKDDGDCKAH